VVSFAVTEEHRTSYVGCGAYLPEYARRQPQIRPALISLLERENQPSDIP
jgi:hypothetical protein